MRSYQWWLPSLDRKAVHWYPLSIAGWRVQCGYRPCHELGSEIWPHLTSELWSFLHALFLSQLLHVNSYWYQIWSLHSFSETSTLIRAAMYVDVAYIWNYCISIEIIYIAWCYTSSLDSCWLRCVSNIIQEWWERQKQDFTTICWNIIHQTLLLVSTLPRKWPSGQHLA